MEQLREIFTNLLLENNKSKEILDQLTDDDLENLLDNSVDYLLEETVHAANNKKNKIISLADKHKYYKPDMTEKWLYDNFHILPGLSDSKDKVFARRFSVYRYDAFVTLDGEIRAYYPEKYIEVQCYDAGTNHPYAAFYYCEFGDYEQLLNEIDKKITAELKKIGVLEKEHQSKYGRRKRTINKKISDSERSQ